MAFRAVSREPNHTEIVGVGGHHVPRDARTLHRMPVDDEKTVPTACRRRRRMKATSIGA
jgi:hypothetical protein